MGDLFIDKSDEKFLIVAVASLPVELLARHPCIGSVTISACWLMMSQCSAYVYRKHQYVDLRMFLVLHLYVVCIHEQGHTALVGHYPCKLVLAQVSHASRRAADVGQLVQTVQMVWAARVFA